MDVRYMIKKLLHSSLLVILEMKAYTKSFIAKVIEKSIFVVVRVL